MICDNTAKLDIRKPWCKGMSSLTHDGVRISIVRTPAPFGGTRSWWLCPRCERRCVLLYTADYICRICAKGRYRSELASPRQRKLRKAFKTREKLGQSHGGIAAPFPPKPKHMHWNTYLRIRKAAERHELEFLQAELADLRRPRR